MEAGKSRGDVLQGTLDLLILKTLQRGPLHGYGITVHLQSVSDDALRVEEGSLYPALHRLERDKILGSEWGSTETGRRAKFYHLTAAGKKKLEAEEENWTRLTKAVTKVLRFV